MGRKICDDMSFYDICDILGGESSISREIVYNLYCLCDDKKWRVLSNIKALDRMEIRGDKIYKLWKYCCGEDFNKLYLTIFALRFDIYTKEERNRNLRFKEPVPFIDDSDVKMEYIDSLNRVLFYERVKSQKELVIKAMDAKRRVKIKNN